MPKLKVDETASIIWGVYKTGEVRRTRGLLELVVLLSLRIMGPMREGRKGGRKGEKGEKGKG